MIFKIDRRLAANWQSSWTPTPTAEMFWSWASRAAACLSPSKLPRQIHAPLDVFIVRKLGVPGREELAFGAIASSGIRYLDSEIVDAVGISDLEIERITAMERQELERRERAYRGGRGPLAVEGQTVILVDDGIATGSSIRRRSQRCAG